jgi:DNA-binding TFAR19-related protein (PDSD5 family)
MENLGMSTAEIAEHIKQMNAYHQGNHVDGIKNFSYDLTQMKKSMAPACDLIELQVWNLYSSASTAPALCNPVPDDMWNQFKGAEQVPPEKKQTQQAKNQILRLRIAYMQFQRLSRSRIFTPQLRTALEEALTELFLALGIIHWKSLQNPKIVELLHVSKGV